MIAPATLFRTLEALPVEDVATWTEGSRTVVVRRIPARHWGDPAFVWQGSDGHGSFQVAAPSVAVAAAQCLRWLASGDRPSAAQRITRLRPQQV